MKILFSSALLLGLVGAVWAQPATTPALRLEPQLFLFRSADFGQITVAGKALTTESRATAVTPPARIAFDDATLQLGAQVTWSGGAVPPALNAVPVPVIESTFDRPASIRSELPAQYFERRGDGTFALRETVSGSPDMPRYQLTFRVQPADASRQTLHVSCEPEIATVQSREKLAGVDLDVGRPVTATFKDRLEFDARPGDWSALVFRSPNGSAYSALLLVRVTAATGAPAAATPAVSRAVDPQAPASVEVRFSDPDKFTDAADDMRGGTFGREDNLDQIREHLIRRARSHLAPGQTLDVTITDVDLAGEFEPWVMRGANRVRIVKEIYAPRIELTFRLTDATGAVIKEGERNLRDASFMYHRTPMQTEARAVEFELLNDWLRNEFVRPRKK